MAKRYRLLMRILPWAVGAFALAGAAAFGIWVGVRAYDELAKRGCVRLSSDVASPRITLTQPGTVRFVALGDTGTGSADQRRVAVAAARICRDPGCDFLVLLGDNFYERGVTGLDDEKFDTLFESVYAPIGKPVFAVLGNHDVKGDVLAQVLHTARSATWRMPNYSFAFQAGPAHFTALNTNCNPLHLFGLGDELAAAPPGWRFVMGHHTVFGDGDHGDMDPYGRWHWRRRIAAHADFYLSGHDHHLSHLRHPDGPMDYVVSGAGGRHYRDSKRPPRPSHAKGLFRHRDNGLVHFEVTEQRVHVRFYDAGGALLYEFQRDKPTP